MKVYTQNIFKYSSIRGQGVTRYPIELGELMLVSKRSKLGKFLNEVESILNGKSATIAIFDYNKYGYVSLVIELDDIFEDKRKELEEIGYRSNY